MREPYSNELIHYGVLGMKWGVRRYQPYSEKPRGSGKGGEEIGDAKTAAKKADRAAKKDRRNAYRNRRSLSDDDLNKRVNRLQKEKQLKDLTEEDLLFGRKKVEIMLKKHEAFNKPARKIIASAVNALAFTAVKEWVSVMFGTNVAGNMGNPFKKK